MVLKSEAWIIEALSPVAVLNDALEIIRLRHEHWDGSGRPKGLKGEAIPIAARVLAVVLAWESNQSSGSSTVVRLALLSKQTGLHFESKLVVQLERLLEERHEPQAEPAKSSTGIIVLAKESRPSITLLQRCSLTSTGARAQFAVALALISVIPMLVVICLCTTGWLGFQVGFDELWPMVAMVMPFMALGCFMLAKYPVNVIRLRRYLESLTRGIAPKHIALVTDEDDMANIEMLMHKVIKQTVARIHTIETQTEALLDAERQRVMIQSLGAACHHLGQPATVISSYLQITLGMELPPKVRPMLEECRTAAEAVAAILERLQRLTVYRTEPYLMQHQEGADFCAAQSIIKM